MKQVFAVTNSDAINRYGDRITVGALVSVLHDQFTSGTPLLMAHDASRIIGWGRPLAVHFEPGLTRSVDIGEIAETEDECRKLSHYLIQYMNQKFLKPNQTHIDYLEETLVDHLRDKRKAIQTECVALVEDGLAMRVFPELFSQQDKDGLIPLDSLSPLGPGLFKVGELIAFSHQFFRRNLFRWNTLNYPFLERLQDLSKGKSSVRIALDPDMVGLASTYHGKRIELQYWWGPQFSDDLSSIPVGVTRHEANEIIKVCFGVSRTEFRWRGDKGQHIFEAEELRDIPSGAESLARYGCRYVHSIVRKDTGAIDHFDGSIRVYTEEEMANRLEIDLAHAGRHTEYTKLWRVDGRIGVPTWKRLLSDYFRDNYLVGEYLGTQTEEEGIWGSGEQDNAPDSIMQEYVPYSMVQGTGVRVALSYHPRGERNSAERSVVCLDQISDGETTYPFVESETLELQKALGKLGCSLQIPPGTKTVSFKDFYVNLPLVAHKKSILPKGLCQTLNAIKMLVGVWNQREHGRVISYKVQFPIDDYGEACISILGHTADLVEWFSNPFSYPPTAAEDLRDWAEQVAEYLGKTFSAPSDTPPLSRTLMPSGLLHIERKRVECGAFQMSYSEKLGGHIGVMHP